jgi:hypothetical protein
LLYKTWDELKEAFYDTSIKGIIIENVDKEGKKIWTYSPITSYIHSKGTDFKEIEDWVVQHTENEVNDIKFWWLSHYNLKRIELDKDFVDQKLMALEKVWDKIVFYRDNPQKYELEVLKKVTIENTSRMRPITDFVKVIEECLDEPELKPTTSYLFIEDPNE